MDSKRFAWPSNILLPVAFSLLRTCWLWPILELIRRWLMPSLRGSLLPWPAMAAIFLAALVAARIAPARDDRLGSSRFAVAALGFATLALILWWRFYAGTYRPWDPQWLASLAIGLTHWGDELPAPGIVLLTVGWLWLRGLLDGQQELHTDRVQSVFSAGIVGFGFGFVLATVDGEGLPAGTGQLLLIFFAAAMVALAASSLQLARGATLAYGEAQVGINRYWLATIALLIVALLGLGVAFSMLIAPQSIMHVLSRLSVLWSLMGRALAVVVLAVVYVAFWLLVPLIRWLQSRFADGTVRLEAAPMESIQEQLAELARSQPPAGDPVAGEALRWLGLVGLLVTVVLAFTLALMRLHRRQQEEIVETREIIFSRDLLEAQLAEMRARWLERLGRRRPAKRSPFMSLEGEAPTRRAIRAIYQALLATATACEHPRLPPQTPSEYQKVLRAALPACGTALGTITDSYIEARYAAHPPAVSRAESAEQAWRRLQAALAAEDATTGTLPPEPTTPKCSDC